MPIFLYVELLEEEPGPLDSEVGVALVSYPLNKTPYTTETLMTQKKVRCIREVEGDWATPYRPAFVY